MEDHFGSFGAPDLRSPLRFMLWLARAQLRNVLGGALFGILWMGAQAVIPAALGAAVEAIARSDRRQLIDYSLLILGLGILQSAAGVMRHRRAVFNFLISATRVEMLVARHAAAIGTDLSRQVGAGEIVNLSANDVERIGSALDVTARFSGAIVSYIAVAVIVLLSSPELGLVLVIGAPVTAAIIGPLMRPLERLQSLERDRRADASSLASDTVVGLRVLRGLGGEEVFSGRFARVSQALRAASVRTALSQSNLDSLQVLLPGALLVVVTFLGARLAVEGRIDPGQLVSFYAYTAFLVLPMGTLMEFASKWTAGAVASQRVINVLSRGRDLAETESPQPGRAGDLVDETTGLRLQQGLLTVVASTDPADAGALADRLGRYHDPADGRAVTLGGVSLSQLPIDSVRSRILVVPSEPILLAGTLEEAFDGAAEACHPADDDQLPQPVAGHRGPSREEALAAASAEDIVAALPEGLATDLPERGRNLSGGQRQRFVLAQALLADPEVLVLDEPTNAVDAHTEAVIAARLRALRAGRTTVVLTTSPLVLEQADRVVLLDGSVLAEGTHRQLMEHDARYRELVTRGAS